jgi:hypothetical protein
MKNLFFTEIVDTVFEIEENKITTAMEIISTIFSGKKKMFTALPLLRIVQNINSEGMCSTSFRDMESTTLLYVWNFLRIFTKPH